MTEKVLVKHQKRHTIKNRKVVLKIISFKNIMFFMLCSFLILINACQNQNTSYAPFLQTKSEQIEASIKAMTLDEKLGQLVFLETDISENKPLIEYAELVKKQQISGVLFSSNHSTDSLYFASIDSLQQITSIPLLFGLAPNNYEKSLMPSYQLSAIVEDSIKGQIIEKNQENYNHYKYNIAFEADLRTITKQDKALQNELFEKQKKDVLANNSSIIKAYQTTGILTGINSCIDFKKAFQSKNDLKNTCFPYQSLSKNGASLVYLDTETFHVDTLKTLEKNGVRDFLKNKLDFRGLSFAHANDKKQLEEQFRTGIDAFIVSANEVENTLKTLKSTFEKGLIAPEQLNESVKKVLMAKDWTNQFEVEKTDIDLKKLEANLGFKNQIAEHSTTVIKDDNNLLPFIEKANQKILLIHNQPFFDLNDLREIEKYDVSNKNTEYPFLTEDDALDLEKLEKYDLIILALNNSYKTEFLSTFKTLENLKNVVLLYTGDFSKLRKLENLPTIIHQNDRYKHRALLSIFGKYKALGQASMNLSNNIKYGQSKALKNRTQLRPKYLLGTPERHSLQKIDTIVQEGISEKAMPSCQIMAIKNGEIYFKKAYGHHTYRKKTTVNTDHIYDLASITKVMSTTVAMMKLYEAEKYQLTDPLHKILDLEKDATIRNITIKELLIHESGLQPNMPINTFFKKRGRYTSKRQANATIQICDGFYVYDKWIDTLWHEIQALEVGEKTYRYSDVNANILQRVIEKLSGKDLDDYVNTVFYEPLLMAHTLYQPLNKYKKKTIVPTEKDRFWRRRLVHGYVHDESAALLGGVAGNAGLFSNVNDMAIMSQMLLNGGMYNGKRYLKKETIDFFTASTHGNHRGLGFNKQRKEGSTGCASVAPMTTYGHTGFTGNCFWIDPESELIYIFLSNRVYPKRNDRLKDMEIRRRIHQVIYDEIVLE